jgi:hypothetical protein
MQARETVFMFLNPECDARYRDLSWLIMTPIAVVSVAVATCAFLFLPIWLALPAAVVTVALGFLAVLKLLNRALPTKFPAGEDL